MPLFRLVRQLAYEPGAHQEERHDQQEVLGQEQTERADLLYTRAEATKPGPGMTVVEINGRVRSKTVRKDRVNRPAGPPAAAVPMSRSIRCAANHAASMHTLLMRPTERG